MNQMDTPDLESSLSIREMELTDAERVALLTEELGYTRSAADIRMWIAGLDSARERQTAFVACVEDEVVGWIEVSMERRLQSPDFALIGGLVVSQHRRCSGIGRQLCEHAERWGWQHGACKVRVTSRSTRADAHRFYLQNGYEAVKTSMVFEKKRG